MPPLLFWLLGAAVLVRIGSAILDRGKEDGGAGLVRWRSHEAAASEAQKENRAVLYDFTAAWCAPCRQLDSEGWADRRIASIVNESFVPTRVVDRAQEEGRNPPAVAEIERRYSIAAFPTLIVADSKGGEIARQEGYAGRQRLMTFLEEARRKVRGN